VQYIRIFLLVKCSKIILRSFRERERVSEHCLKERGGDGVSNWVRRNDRARCETDISNVRREKTSALLN
jgi:hypothetical protein